MGSRHQLCQIEALRQMITTIGDQAADIESGLTPLVTPPAAVAFLDPPTNGAFAGIVGTVQDFISLGILPGTIEGQARPQAPAVKEEAAHPVSQASCLSGTGDRGLGVA